MKYRGWEKAMKQLRGYLAENSVLHKYAPRYAASADRRLSQVSRAPVRIGVAGAQGLGKSTLVKGLLASPRCPEPPIPVREREETRIPVISVKRKRPALAEIFRGGRTREREQRVTEEDVRVRASADSSVFDKVKYRKLEALIVYDPDFDLAQRVELVDLPGVGGHLAGISKWAEDYLLGGDLACLVFVVDSSQSIDSSHHEANLIRAFGPQLLKSVFVQNLWSGYPDPVEETRAANLEFLNKHLGKDSVRYVMVDLRSAGRAKAEGDSQIFAPLDAELGPLLAGDRSFMVLAEVIKAKNQCQVVEARLQRDLHAARGEHDKHQEATDELKQRLKELQALAKSLKAHGNRKCDDLGSSLRSTADNVLDRFSTGLVEYIDNAKHPVTQKLLEREVSNRIGEANRSLVASYNKGVAALRDELRKKIEAANARFRLKGAAGIDLPAPEFNLDLDGLVKFVAVLKKGLAIGGSVGGAVGGTLGGAKAGGVIGALIGGPPGAAIGAVVGGIVGGILGMFGGRKAGQATGNQVHARLKDKQKRAFRERMGKELPALKKKVRSSIQGSIVSLRQTLEGEVDEVMEALHEAAHSEAPTDEAEFEDSGRAVKQIQADLKVIGRTRRALLKLEQHLESQR